MSNYSLHDETLKFVNEERRLTGLVIENLQKIRDSKLYLKMGYSSLFEYTVKALGYSESSAYRRISAIKITQVLPEIKEKLNSGELNLTNLSMAQSFFSKTKVEVQKQKEVLEKIENCSKRETEKILVLEFENPRMTYAELIDDMCEYILKKLDPMRRSPNNQITVVPAASNPRTISAELKRRIWHRDHDRCTYRDPKTNRRCESRHLLQIDHIQPVSHGGQATEQNLRLLCHSHHKLRDMEL